MRWDIFTTKFDANIEAVILWQSVQLQMKLSTRPGASVGNLSWTAPQKQVAVASVSEDHPSSASPESGMYGLVLSADLRDIVFVVWFWSAWRRDRVSEVCKFEFGFMKSWESG